MFALKGDEARYALTGTLFQESIGAVLETIQSIENANDHDAGMRASTHSMTNVRNR
jgi:hypothetical protein